MRLFFVGLCAVFTSVLPIGCSKQPAAQGTPSSALIMVWDESARPLAIPVTDPQGLRELESFFPGYQNRPTSEIAGLWDSKYTVYFNFPGGISICVLVSENENARFWSIGESGDFLTQGNFNAFVARLQAERAEKEGAPNGDDAPEE